MAKVDIFSGFLGAGKTTLIRKLISEAYEDEKIVLIENEFGEIGVDSGFLKDTGVQINEMNSGCICCTLVGDFGRALNEVIDTYDPDRILIEPSGVGKLSDVIIAVQDLKNDRIELNGFTTVVDAKKARVYMTNFGEFYQNQVEHASSIILSHTDGLSHEHSQHHDHHDHHDHDHDHDHEHHHDHDHHDHEHHDHDHDHHGHHHADEVFDEFGVYTAHKFTAEQIEEALKALSSFGEYGQVLRAKGIVEGEDGQWIHFDYVPGEPEVRTGSAETTGLICVIGVGLDKEAIEELFGL